MKISTLLWIGLVVVVGLIAIGYRAEQTMLSSSPSSSESFRFQSKVDECQQKIKESCKDLYPSHLDGLSEQDIIAHPDYQLYKDCVESAARFTC